MGVSEAEVKLAPGRSCQGCTMCCKIMAIPALAKPAMTWCTHCAVGTGCRIYPDRPEDCRVYFCQWVVDGTIGQHWHPAKSRMVLSYKPGQNQIMIHVDADRPDAWRKEPFHAEIRRWVAKL